MIDKSKYQLVNWSNFDKTYITDTGDTNNNHFSHELEIEDTREIILNSDAESIGVNTVIK